MRAPLDFALQLAIQAQNLDPNLGTQKAQQGAVQRIADPNMYDVVFPVIAFLLVILLPAATAAWVIYKTVREKTAEPDET